MKISSVLFLSLLFCLTSAAFADGTYQKTQDGKTLVWNNHPEPGDSATWSGGRDENRYASGHGTLTWYHTQKKIVTGSNLPMPKYSAIASYTGEMVHGKLNGEVTAVDANGKKFHGKFVDGQRKNWMPGVAKEVVASAKAPAEPQTRRGELVESPAEGPDETATESKPPEKITEKPAAEPSPAAKKPNEFDDSLRSLVGPPTSLHSDTNKPSARSTSSASPAPQKSATTSAPAASATPSPEER